MVKKMGRPTNNPKKYDTRIRMTEEEIEILNFCAEKMGMTKADVIRTGIRKVYEEIKEKK